LVAQLTFNQLVVGSNPTGGIMKDNEILIHALTESDKLQIIFAELMEFWLEGKEPPTWLVDQYYDQLEEVQVAFSADKLHEVVAQKNRDFYDDLQNKLEGLLDNTPDLF
jgi:uncharacterized protein YbaP (TraB family)